MLGGGSSGTWQRPGRVRILSPIYPDAFRSGGQVVRFPKDSNGRTTELSLSLGRVYDMRFARDQH